MRWVGLAGGAVCGSPSGGLSFGGVGGDAPPFRWRSEKARLFALLPLLWGQWPGLMGAPRNERPVLRAAALKAGAGTKLAHWLTWKREVGAGTTSRRRARRRSLLPAELGLRTVSIGRRGLPAHSLSGLAAAAAAASRRFASRSFPSREERRHQLVLDGAEHEGRPSGLEQSDSSISGRRPPTARPGSSRHEPRAPFGSRSNSCATSGREPATRPLRRREHGAASRPERPAEAAGPVAPSRPPPKPQVARQRASAAARPADWPRGRLARRRQECRAATSCPLLAPTSAPAKVCPVGRLSPRGPDRGPSIGLSAGRPIGRSERRARSTANTPVPVDGRRR